MTVNSFLVNLGFFGLSVLAFAIFYTWVFNHTRASLFIAILIHTSTNANLLPQLFPAPSITSTDLFGVIGYGVPALLIIFFTRGRLGFERT